MSPGLTIAPGHVCCRGRRTALARASATTRHVAIRGAGTKSGWGRPPRPSTWCVDREAERVLAHRHGDLTATVQAGATLARVNARCHTGSGCRSIRRAPIAPRSAASSRRTTAARCAIATARLRDLVHRRRTRPPMASRRKPAASSSRTSPATTCAAADRLVRQPRRHVGAHSSCRRFRRRRGRWWSRRETQRNAIGWCAR